jgi:hypothetical protein
MAGSTNKRIMVNIAWVKSEILAPKKKKTHSGKGLEGWLK